MEFLKIVRRRSFLSEVSYIVLNVALAVGIILLIRITESPWLAIGLVLLSKWRVFAVRPRYWIVNLQSNLVDYIISLSFVLFSFLIYSGEAVLDQKIGLLVGLTLLYIAWLIFVRPRSKRLFVVIQGGVALFAGTAILYTLAYAMPLSVVVLLMWIIGYATAKHVLANYNEETHVVLLSQIWGLLMAEIGWIAYHWTIAYSFGSSNIVIPRVALTVLCLGFVAYKCYDSYHHFKKIRSTDIVLPILFSFGIIIVLPIILSLLGLATAIGV